MDLGLRTSPNKTKFYYCNYKLDYRKKQGKYFSCNFMFRTVPENLKYSRKSIDMIEWYLVDLLTLTNACIYFYHKGILKYTGVMMKGKMEVLTNQETKNMIWRKGDTMFYKGGVSDPDYCVLKFTAESGRYYCDLKTESFKV